MAQARGPRISGRRVRTFAIVCGVVIVGVGTLFAAGKHTVRSKQTLTATSAAPAAHGKAHLTLQSSKKGKFSVVASHLKGGKTYDVIIRGVKVGVINTSAGGSGKALFSTTPGTNATLLGFNPSGGQILVRETDDGEDVLVGDMPDDDAGEVACCLPQGEDGDGQSQVECEEMTATECTDEGGTVGMAAGTTAASCLPDPCATTPPPGAIVCCTNATEDDESEAECEDVTTQAECAGNGGTVVQASSCDPNPCQVTPPVDQAACCVMRTDDGESETECEVISSAACTAAGGTAPGAATCDADPCGSGSGDGGGGGGDMGGDD
jgi:hypothetical protein